MKKKRRTSILSKRFGEEPVVYLWILRLLVPLGGHRNFVSKHGFSDEKLANLLGFGELLDKDINDSRLTAVRAELRRLHQDAEREMTGIAISLCLSRNIERLSNLVGLSDIDTRIIEFAILIYRNRHLDTAADYLEGLSSMEVCRVLSELLDLPEHDVRSALSSQGILAKSGLLTIAKTSYVEMSLKSKLDLLSDKFADIIASSDTDPVSLIRDIVALSAPAELGIGDYGHIERSLSCLRPYLKVSLDTVRKGTNILLCGDPGTGKSQLTKALAKELNCELFEVSSEDDEGDPVDGQQRLRAYRAAQHFFSQRRALILFDEAEDVFNDGSSHLGFKSTAQNRKAWINRMLEDNSVPTFWVSNSIRDIDPAFIRRFDMVIELPVPPKKQRERILMDMCSDLIETSCIARIAESESLAPAVVSRAASVVRSIREDLGEKGTARAFEFLISNTLLAQGHQAIRMNDPNRLPDLYDPRFINADSNLDEISKGLKNSRSARICLFGPPGTGKTAFGRWLAEQLDMPLIIKRASDLISMWLGESEQNIARAFRQAEQEGALLLIDEVDSFLQDRRGAQRSWEVSQVNEMLTQMESFSGVFVASTNLMAGLDQASLRRFDLKVHFDYMLPKQACELLQRYCQQLNVDLPKSDQIARLTRLKQLTPGDFTTVARQHRFKPILSAKDMVTALEAECAIKEGGKAAIGFIH